MSKSLRMLSAALALCSVSVIGVSPASAQQTAGSGLPVCKSSLGTITMMPDSDISNWWRKYKLNSPRTVIKTLVERSGCFTYDAGPFNQDKADVYWLIPNNPKVNSTSASIQFQVISLTMNGNPPEGRGTASTDSISDKVVEMLAASDSSYASSPAGKEILQAMVQAYTNTVIAMNGNLVTASK